MGLEIELGIDINEVEVDYSGYEVSKRDQRVIEKKKKVLEGNFGCKKDKKDKKETLVLWDIENINFYNDYKAIECSIKDKMALRYVIGKEPQKYSNTSRLSNGRMFPRLRKRGWLIEKISKKVDEKIMDYYYKHKSHIKTLILITDDSDFEVIIKDAIKNKIEVEILHINENSSWLQKYNNKLLLEKEEK